MASRDVVVGCGVGVSDLAFVYPLAVLACRREAGLSLKDAIVRGRLWSGATTQLTLIPYSIAVEAGTKFFQNNTSVGPLGAAVIISSAVTATLQPFEKKLVVDQLLQQQQASGNHKNGHSKNPLRAIAKYGQHHGIRALYQGASALFFREFIYVCTISVINPIVSQAAERQVGERSSRTTKLSAGAGAAFSCGFAAGMISAPFQTLNVLMKDEANRGATIRNVLRKDVFKKGWAAALNRLFFGAAMRSARCGGAGVLYFSWRHITAVAMGEQS